VKNKTCYQWGYKLYWW